MPFAAEFLLVPFAATQHCCNDARHSKQLRYDTMVYVLRSARRVH
jgi:hypothetical protein